VNNNQNKNGVGVVDAATGAAPGAPVSAQVQFGGDVVRSPAIVPGFAFQQVDGVTARQRGALFRFADTKVCERTNGSGEVFPCK
jgi:hypothetical protein